MAALLPALLLGEALASPRIFLYTMGHDQALFTRYGHAALCVRQEGWSSGVCYAYGYTDFSSPARTVWEFMRGEGVYWGDVDDEATLLARYVHRDSDIWRQELDLPPEQKQALIDHLDASVTGTDRTYHYHHFYDNCSTRLRDAIDVGTGGALRQGTDVPDGPPYRALAEDGLAGILPLQLALQVGLGREADHPTTPWQRMFLPATLREVVATRLGAAPERLWTRSGSAIPETARRGRLVVALGGLLLGLLALPRGRAGRALVGLGLGIPALFAWTVAALTALGELRWNESLLVLWPTDLLLPALGPDRLRRYLGLRLGALALVAALRLVGLFIQPLGPNLLLAALPLGALLWRTRSPSGAA